MSFIKPGHTYKLTHTKTHAVLNLSMADFQSLAGAPWDASDNQKWVAERARSPQPGMTRWVFRSVATGLYLGIDGTPRAAARVVATRDETEWDVRADKEDPSVLRIVVPNGRLGLQLGEKNAYPAPGAPAKLWEVKEGEEQRWRLEEGEGPAGWPETYVD